MAQMLLATRARNALSLDECKSLYDDFEKTVDTYVSSKKSSIIRDSRTIFGNHQTQHTFRSCSFEADEEQIAALAASLPRSLMLETVVQRYPQSRRFSPEGKPSAPQMRSATNRATGSGVPFRIYVRANGHGMAGVTVALHLSDPTAPYAQPNPVVVTTDEQGLADFIIGPSWVPQTVVVQPKTWYWSTVKHKPSNGQVIELRPLDLSRRYGYWQEMVGMARDRGNFGGGIKIGVIDSGVGPNENLINNIKMRASIAANHEIDLEGGTDTFGHGTFVAGLIGAVPLPGAPGYVGLAKDAEIYSVRVFEEGSEQTSTSDVINAIHFLTNVCGVDIINMSLGWAQPSQVEFDVIEEAFSKGVVCICASGNDNPQPVSYPAAYPNTAAVSALGYLPATPPETISSGFIPQPPTPNLVHPNGVFVPQYTTRGNAITVTAPGTAIMSTAVAQPGDPAPYTEDDGTSMAAPIVTACLANWLAVNDAYLRAPRTRERAQLASQILVQQVANIGFAPAIQGAGLTQGTR